MTAPLHPQGTQRLEPPKLFCKQPNLTRVNVIFLHAPSQKSTTVQYLLTIPETSSKETAVMNSAMICRTTLPAGTRKVVPVSWEHGSWLGVSGRF